MISYVLNMISHVISNNDIVYTFHMQNITKSCMISYLYEFKCI